LLVLPGCGGGLSPAICAYDQAEYPEAIVELRRAEAEYRAANGRDRTRYALYRGLTHLALGDVAQASVWLTRSKRAITWDPELLTSAERGRLDAAWRSMGYLTGDADALR
jgi:hypothetical protein